MSAVRATIEASLAKRSRAERRFRWYGRLALGLTLAMLAFLLFSILRPGLLGFVQYQLKLDIVLDVQDADGKPNYHRAAQEAMLRKLPEAETQEARMELYRLLSLGSDYLVRNAANDTGKQQFTVWLPLADVADQFFKGRIDRQAAESERPISDAQIAALDMLKEKGLVRAAFNPMLFTEGDSRSPELAGFLGSMIGSLFTVMLCLLIAVPIGVMSAIYLQEFAPKNALTSAIEVNINNLAAVPSIIFGLLGLSLYLNWLGWPRSSAVVGGATLAMLILPVIIIATRAALQAVPPSLREAAAGIGASPLQIAMHHTVPAALPGILTGIILGVARAIGETAPLLMIGMVAFVADIPRTPLDSATVMPVQVYLWASSPEMGFIEKTSTGILVLLVVLMLMNLTAILLRRKFEVRW